MEKKEEDENHSNNLIELEETRRKEKGILNFDKILIKF